MKISILTPSFNQGKFIEQNILSVLNQNYPDFEHIIIDGGSTDSTVNILKKYPHLIWKSEKDDGQADALNKALALATGDIIGWINSDDYYLPSAFDKVKTYFLSTTVSWVVGNIKLFHNHTGKEYEVIASEITYKRLCFNPDLLKQPGTFFRKDFICENNGFNKKFNMVMDLDLWLRLSKVSKPLMVKDYLAVFRIQSEQKTSLTNQYKQLMEIRELANRENSPQMLINKIIKTLFTYVKYILKKGLFYIINPKLDPSKPYGLKASIKNYLSKFYFNSKN